MRSVIVLFGCWLCSCSLITGFDEQAAEESSDALCADGFDNDDDGLTDCQDWKCLPRTVCCTEPVTVLEDDFGGDACAARSCDDPLSAQCGFDKEKWVPWGLPLPRRCENSFAPYKAEACYEVGMLAKRSLTLHSGLVVVAHVSGVPEVGGGLEVGLTLQQSITGGMNTCVPVSGADPVVSLRQRASGGGSVWVARFDRAEVGTSAEVAGSRHEVRFGIDGEGRVVYLLDGVQFARSPADRPLPLSAPRQGRLLAFGRGLSVRLDDVRVDDGTQCESPGAWFTATPFVQLDAAPNPVWDGNGVLRPTVGRAQNGAPQIYYIGCGAPALPGTCRLRAFGLAAIADAGPLTRDARNPFAGAVPVVDLDFSVLRTEAPLPMDWMRGLVSTNADEFTTSLSILPISHTTIGQLRPNRSDALLQSGPTGSWDDQDVCCPAAIEQGRTVRMWYAGRGSRDGIWRIGLAISNDGVVFQKHPLNPVMQEGGTDAPDGRGVFEPEVVYDAQKGLYRMWYTARALFDVTSVGHAASTDGISWHKFPGNPVITPSAIGLESIGSPAVEWSAGRTRMWVHGSDSGSVTPRIYGLANTGEAPR